MHNHVSAVDGAVVAAYMIIFLALWRTVAAHLADKPVGQAMAFIA